MKYQPESLVEILQQRAKDQPQELAIRFLTDGENEEIILTYSEVDRLARSIGALLQFSTSAGDRVLILMPPGQDFIAAFLGCLYAGVIAIPAYPPHPVRYEKTLPVIHRIVTDASPTAALMSSSLLDAINDRNTGREIFGHMKLLVTDKGDLDQYADQWRQPEIGKSDIAFLQYTSGSTTIPKGVILSHSNLLHNMALIAKCYGVTAESRGVIWLPPYHDMGLIGGITQPLYSGIPVTLMPHMLFLQRPIRWLQAISHYRGTISGGPNFAYDLCIRKIKPEQRDNLDLSSWRVAFNGAEPVNPATLTQFADYFAPCGFRLDAFLPCYGLAESTLMVAGGPRSRPPVTLTLMKEGIEQNRIIISAEKNKATRTIVSCGQNLSDQHIRIVNPETKTLSREDEIGEIWVSGSSVAKGYWNKYSETESTFGARLEPGGEGPFLRSGDLGFIYQDELYITGRFKNLIITDGKNHYPQDIERTVQGAHPAIRPAGCAAFSIDDADLGRERIIIVAELERWLNSDREEIIKAILKAVADNHGLHADDIKLVIPGSIPRTTSGKIRHFICKSTYLAGALKEINLT